MSTLDSILNFIYCLSQEICCTLNNLGTYSEIKKNPNIHKLYASMDELRIHALAVRRNLKANLFEEDFAYHLGKIYSKGFSAREYCSSLLQEAELATGNMLINQLKSQLEDIEAQLSELDLKVSKIFNKKFSPHRASENNLN